jgi:molybdopterin biosynthesis enzyme
VESAVETPTNPPIARLTPLAEVLALIDRDVKPLGTTTLRLDAALGRVLAADVVAPGPLPPKAIALIDGWALSAQATQDASGYAPALLPTMPARVAAGQPMPAGADCIAAFDVVKVTGARAEALTPCNAGDGVLPAGSDCDPAVPLRRAGERLRAVDIAAFANTGITNVPVRMPRFLVAAAREDPVLTQAMRLIQADIERRGGVATQDISARDALLNPGPARPVAIVGGTGSGDNDHSVRLLASMGRLAVHGIALTPGETAAYGMAGETPLRSGYPETARPVPRLLLPGRLDAALAVWLTLGRRILHRLQGAKVFEDPFEVLTLSRKITSTVGMAELVPMRRTGDSVEPLATKYLPWSALTRSDGWILVPAESEGYSVGAKVSVRPWP